MGLTDGLLSVLRWWLYVSASGLAILQFILDAVAISALNDYHVGGGRGKGAAGWTIFVAILTFLIIPIMLFGRSLASRGIGAAQNVNKLGVELIIVSVLTLFWFISGVTMAKYSDSDFDCSYSICRKYKAATAFAWITFFDVLCALVFLAIRTSRARRAGEPIMAVHADSQAQAGLPPPATFKQSEYPSQGMAPPQGTAGNPGGFVEPYQVQQQQMQQTY